MSYTLLAGEFVIRYPDLPRGGPEPDGDTVKFAPDSPALVDGLPRVSGRPPELNARGISVRLEAIDALETHFSETHQELAGANAARDLLLAALGFTGIGFWPDLPNKVESADRDRARGHVVSNGIDADGRMIGFVYEGDAPEPDGARLFLDAARAERSVNARLLAEGHAYPAFYATLPASLREPLAARSRAARAAGLGIWPRSTADPDGPARIAGLAELEALVLWPKLFRRLVPYLAAGYEDFDGLDAWLRADPVDRDDELLLLDRLERGNLHDVVEAAGERVQLTVWPEDFVIRPDPAPPGAAAGVAAPSPVRAEVVIVAALPNPAGTDAGAESVTLLNTAAAPVDLAGWSLSDGAGGRQALDGELAAGATRRVALTGSARLGNEGGTIRLADARGRLVDQVVYEAREVRPGRTIAFRA